MSDTHTKSPNLVEEPYNYTQESDTKERLTLSCTEKIKERLHVKLLAKPKTNHDEPSNKQTAPLLQKYMSSVVLYSRGELKSAFSKSVR